MDNKLNIFRRNFKNEDQINKDKELIRQLYLGERVLDSKLWQKFHDKCVSSLKSYCLTHRIPIETNVDGIDIEDIFSSVFAKFYIQVKEQILTPNNLPCQISSHLYGLGVWYIKTVMRRHNNRNSKINDILDQMGVTPIGYTSPGGSQDIDGVEIEHGHIDVDKDNRTDIDDILGLDRRKPLVNRISLPKDIAIGAEQDEFELSDWKNIIREVVHRIPEPCATIFKEQFLYDEVMGECYKSSDILSEDYGIKHIKMVKHRCMHKAKKMLENIPGFLETINTLFGISPKKTPSSPKAESCTRIYRYDPIIDEHIYLDDINELIKLRGNE